MKYKNRVLIIVVLFLIFGINLFAQEIGTRLPKISGKTHDGTQFTVPIDSGKIVIIDFWASWCGPCRKGIPYLAELFEQYRDKGVLIVGINVDDKESKAGKFLDKISKQPAFPIILDTKAEYPPIFNVQVMPTTFFVDRKGIIRYILTGFDENHKELYIKYIKELSENK